MWDYRRYSRPDMMDVYLLHKPPLLIMEPDCNCRICSYPRIEEPKQMIPHLSTRSYPTDVGLPPNKFPCDNSDLSSLDELLSENGEFATTVSPEKKFDKYCKYGYDYAIYHHSDAYADACKRLYPYVMKDSMWGAAEDKQRSDNTNYVYDPLDFISLKDCLDPSSVFQSEVPPYTPDNDHCYSAPANKQVISVVDDKLDVLKNIPTPPSTSESPSETSSEDEVDVVTVMEDNIPPVVSTKFDDLHRTKTSRPQRNARKSKRTQKNFSAQSLKAAMKRTRIQNIRSRTHRRRKTYSVAITPSNSMPSSSQSSRCSSDVEDLDKRENHNCSERKRREVQRTALQYLRICIPDLHNNPKAPKVLILKKATEITQKLKLSAHTFKRKRSKESRKNKDLTARVNQLKLEMNLSPSSGFNS